MRPSSDEEYIQFIKVWERLFGKGSGGDIEEVSQPEKGHRPAVHKGDEGVKAKAKGS